MFSNFIKMSLVGVLFFSNVKASGLSERDLSMAKKYLKMYITTKLEPRYLSPQGLSKYEDIQERLACAYLDEKKRAEDNPLFGGAFLQVAENEYTSCISKLAKKREDSFFAQYEADIISSAIACAHQSDEHKNYVLVLSRMYR